MPRPSSHSSPRSLVAKFAAHLAHLLNNGSGGVVEVSAFALFQTLTRTLASSAYAQLIGLGLAAPDATAETTAQGYFDAVLDRRLFLARDEQTHKGHAVFLAMCRRGAENGWTKATLERKLVSTAERILGSDVGPRAMSFRSETQRSFASVAEKLAQLDDTISPGNPAASTLAKFGPLVLELDGSSAVAPEEMSVWKAIITGPERLRQLAKGKEFDAFCSIVIKAVEAANAPFGALVAVGLPPRDWSGEISTHAMKKLGAFLSDVRKQSPVDAGGARGGVGTLATWREVWKRRQVPGYASADDLWNSPLGRALRFPVMARSVEISALDDDFDRTAVQDGEFVVEDAEFEAQLSSAAGDGVVDKFDIWLLREIRARGLDDELKSHSRVRLRLTAHGDLDAYFDELTERLYTWAQRKHGHPDNNDEPPEDE